jgi:hypothetical protein
MSVASVDSGTRGMDRAGSALGDRVPEHRRAPSMDCRVRVRGPWSSMELASDPVSGRHGAAVMLRR